MGGAMPAMISALDAIPTRTEPCKTVEPCTQVSALEEGEIDERKFILGYSSSPPPLSEDHSGLLEDRSPVPSKPTDVQVLRNELELSTREYAALDERYSTLSGQHRTLYELASTYDDVIWGSSHFSADMKSIEKLRVEAGQKGLRAKALETDALQPMICEAGGVQAFITRAQALQTLVDGAGGLQELTEEISTSRVLTHRLAEVGGLQGLDRLVSELYYLRSERCANAELRTGLDGPGGLRSKALKYDMLQQAFAAISRGPIDRPIRAIHFPTPNVTNRVPMMSAPAQRSKGPVISPARAQLLPQITPTEVPARSAPASSSANGPVINPARAQLLYTAPDGRDPDRDLYEPPPPPPKPSKKTGSNDIPLGGKRRREGGASSEQEFAGSDPKRLKYEDEPEPAVAPTRRRRKVDVGLASAMVHANIQNKAIVTRNDAAIGRPQYVGRGGSDAAISRPAWVSGAGSSDAAHSRPAWVGGGGSNNQLAWDDKGSTWQARFATLLGSSSTSSPAGGAPSDGRLSREPASRSPQPSIKMEVNDGL